MLYIFIFTDIMTCNEFYLHSTVGCFFLILRNYIYKKPIVNRCDNYINQFNKGFLEVDIC